MLKHYKWIKKRSITSQNKLRKIIFTPFWIQTYKQSYLRRIFCTLEPKKKRFYSRSQKYRIVDNMIRHFSRTLQWFPRWELPETFPESTERIQSKTKSDSPFLPVDYNVYRSKIKKNVSSDITSVAKHLIKAVKKKSVGQSNHVQ